jgi:putative MATE family efflux protein
VRRPDITEGSILGGLTHLTTPMLAGAVFQNAQSLIDLFWVGRLGPSAVASVAMAGTVLMVLFPMLMGASTGTVALVARATGAGRPEEANKTTGQSLMLALVLGGVTGVAGWFCSHALIGLLGAAPDVVAGGGVYLRISLLGSFTAFVLFIGNAALQGAGDAVTPMWIMMVSNVINIGLAPLFIFGLGILPPMGVRGAAIATVLAQAIAACISVYYLVSGRARLHVRLSQWEPDLTLCWRILRIGIPGSGQMLARSLSGVVMMRIVAACGTASVAAYGVGLRFHMIILMPAFALGGAAATMVGQNLGAAKPHRAGRAAWLATAVDAAFMALAAAVLFLSAPRLIHFFNADSEVVSVGAHYLRVVSPFYVFAALGVVLGRALNGAGDSMSPMIITMVCLWGLQVPLAILFSRLWQPATQGIWWAIVVAMVLQGLLIAGWFQTGRWKRARV